MNVVRLLTYGIAKTLSKVFGLATITFFGRVPSKDDDKVGAIGLISLTWCFVLVAVAYPAFGELIFPLLEDEAVIRSIAAALAITLPLAVGFLVTRVGNRSHERDARAVARELLFGYGYAAIVGGLVLALVLVVPVVKASYLLRRFDLKHVAILVDDEHYDDVVERIRSILDDSGLDPTVQRPHWAIWRIFTALAWMEGHIFRRHVARDMKVVRGRTPRDETVEVTVHATDITILGSQHATTLVMALLAEELEEDLLYFSWDDESQRLEDRLRALRAGLVDGTCTPSDDQIDELCADLRELSLESEEWNAIRRHIYRLEAACLRARLEAAGDAGAEDAPPQRAASEPQLADSSTSSSGSRGGSSSSSGSSPLR